MQKFHFLQIIIFQGFLHITLQDFFLFLEHTVDKVLVVLDKHGRPRAANTRGVLSGKEQGNQKTRDLLHGDGCTILVLDVHEQ